MQKNREEKEDFGLIFLTDIGQEGDLEVNGPQKSCMFKTFMGEEPFQVELVVSAD